MTRRRLVCVHRGDFRKNELTLFREVQKKYRGIRVGAHDVVALVSGTGKQIKFVYGFTELSVFGKTQQETGNSTQVLRSDTYRIDGPGTWNPLMLANYASAVGIELAGLKKFEETYAKLAK